MTNDLVKAREQSKNMLSKLVAENPMTLAGHGLEPEKFRDVCAEALMANPNLHLAQTAQLGQALRRCVQTGMIPNNRDAAIIVNKNGSVRFQTMVDGLCKYAHQKIGVTIRSGHVLAGEEFKMQHDSETGDRVLHTKNPFAIKENADVIGAYAEFSKPGHKTFVHMWYGTDIRKAKAASSVKSPDGPWAKWEGRMAEKGVVKSGIILALRMFPDLDPKAVEQLHDVVDAENAAEVQDTIEVEDAEFSEPVKVVIEPEDEHLAEDISEEEYQAAIEPEPVKEAPKPKPKPKPKAEAKPKTEPMQGPSPSTEKIYPKAENVSQPAQAEVSDPLDGMDWV